MASLVLEEGKEWCCVIQLLYNILTTLDPGQETGLSEERVFDAIFPTSHLAFYTSFLSSFSLLMFFHFLLKVQNRLLNVFLFHHYYFDEGQIWHLIYISWQATYHFPIPIAFLIPCIYNVADDSFPCRLGDSAYYWKCQANEIDHHCWKTVVENLISSRSVCFLKYPFLLISLQTNRWLRL